MVNEVPSLPQCYICFRSSLDGDLVNHLLSRTDWKEKSANLCRPLAGILIMKPGFEKLFNQLNHVISITIKLAVWFLRLESEVFRVSTPSLAELGTRDSEFPASACRSFACVCSPVVNMSNYFKPFQAFALLTAYVRSSNSQLDLHDSDSFVG